MAEPQRHRRDNEAGFTLLELLVALTLLGLAAGLIGSALSALYYAGRAQHRGTSDAAVQAAQRLLRARISHLVPVPRDDLSVPRVQAQGTSTRFAFIGSPADRDGPGPLRYYRIELTPGGALTLLSASTVHAQRDDLATSPRAWTRTILLDEVRGIELGYFGLDPRTAKLRWQTDWRDRAAAPDLVRIRLDLGPARGGGWPDLIVPVPAVVSLNCAQLAGDGRCAGGDQ